MTDRAAELSALADRIAAREDVRDAWTAKSFTDRILVVEVPPDAELPADVERALREHDCRGADEAYDLDGAESAAFAGDLDDGRRYRFVDTRSRGELQSYVVD
ncbi:hypothetical protein [Halomicrobium salinisoli]|uniref:hypothetical protein n=1 Tax=Halomicrobium salinisoli TaxID=2878391 RepID=UPI001CEFF9B5|nr:hypothetical protein [Halomicrobium salinisoli]